MMQAEVPGSRVPVSRLVEQFGLDAERLKRMFSDAHPSNERLKSNLAGIGVSLVASEKERGEVWLAKAA
jgi:hypothetical protein